MPQAGQYKERVAIQVNTPDTAADGQQVENWSTWRERPASVIATGGSETRRGYQLRADIDYVVRMRNDSVTRTITPQHRLLWLTNGNRELHITRATPVGDRKREIECQCVESLAPGEAAS